MLISFAVTTELICVFFFANANSQFSHDVAHFQLLDASSNQQVCKKEEKQLFLKVCKIIRAQQNVTEVTIEPRGCLLNPGLLVHPKEKSRSHQVIDFFFSCKLEQK